MTVTNIATRTDTTADALRQLLDAAALSRQESTRIDIDAGLPAYRSRVRCAEVAAAALAAGGVAASALWHMRTGRRQTVRVALREAAASLASFSHLRFVDASRDPGLGPRTGPDAPAASGFFATADGRFIYLHPSFPPNHARILELLGVTNDHAAISHAVAGRDASELEAQLRARGLTAAVAQSPAQWNASVHGRELTARPVVEVIRIGDSAPEPFRQGSAPAPAADGMSASAAGHVSAGPLTGMRVLDLTRVLAGPTCAQPGWEQLAQTATGSAWLHGGAQSPQLQPCALTNYTTGYLAAFGALVAMIKRARYGGSYLVRVALCRTAMFARSLGLHAAPAMAQHTPFTAAEIAGWQRTSHGGYGELLHLGPAVHLSDTPTRWSLPAAPLASHSPGWL